MSDLRHYSIMLDINANFLGDNPGPSVQIGAAMANGNGCGVRRCFEQTSDERSVKRRRTTSDNVPVVPLKPEWMRHRVRLTSKINSTLTPIDEICMEDDPMAANEDDDGGYVMMDYGNVTMNEHDDPDRSGWLG